MNRGAVLLRRTERTQREIAVRLRTRGVSVSVQAVGFWRLGLKRPAPARRRVLAIEFGIPIAAWEWPATYEPPAPPPWRTAWRDARRELRHVLRLRVAISTLARAATA